MPRYEYSCPICLTGEVRFASIEARDKQLCAAPVFADASLNTDVPPRTCGAALERVEIPDGVTLKRDTRDSFKLVLKNGERIVAGRKRRRFG